jgi:hypothetical protein
VIYVPTYNPQVVYVSSGPPPGSAAIAFGVGLAIGAWLNRDWHWYGPGIYYHGWAGAGWISVNRTYVHVNNVYVNRSFTHVNVNRTVVNRNIVSHSKQSCGFSGNRGSKSKLTRCEGKITL